MRLIDASSKPLCRALAPCTRTCTTSTWPFCAAKCSGNQWSAADAWNCDTETNKCSGGNKDDSLGPLGLWIKLSHNAKTLTGSGCLLVALEKACFTHVSAQLVATPLLGSSPATPAMESRKNTLSSSTVHVVSSSSVEMILTNQTEVRSENHYQVLNCQSLTAGGAFK